jgi:hypothetical protein
MNAINEPVYTSGHHAHRRFRNPPFGQVNAHRAQEKMSFYKDEKRGSNVSSLRTERWGCGDRLPRESPAEHAAAFVAWFKHWACPNMRLRLIAIMSILGYFAGCAQASPEAEFWRWFQRNESALFDFERDQEQTLKRLAAEMHKVHPSLTFEFGPKQGGHREFVISADGDRKVFPKVESLYEAAPPLPKWRLIKFRPRREPFDLQYNGIWVKASSVSVLLQAEGAKAVVIVCIPGYSEAARRDYLGIAFLLLDQALGEYDVETRVGSIEVRAPSSPAAAAAHSLRQLPDLFDALLSKR